MPAGTNSSGSQRCARAAMKDTSASNAALARAADGETIIFSDLSQVPGFQELSWVNEGRARSGGCVALPGDPRDLLLFWSHPKPRVFGGDVRSLVQKVMNSLAESLRDGVNALSPPKSEPGSTDALFHTPVQRTSDWADRGGKRRSVSLLPQGHVFNGRYELKKQIGRGGYATIYEAWDSVEHRIVAVKVLNTYLNEATPAGNRTETMLRFRREALLMQRVRHRFITTIFDYDVTDRGHPFIVMERLFGHDLGRELRRFGPMAPGRVLPLMVDALQALGVAHDIQVVHRDLKPSNLFLIRSPTGHEEIRILDFGVAAQLEESNLTQSGFRMGTARYMTPEIINQESVCPASDVYQMALILVEALEGRPVVSAKDPMQCMFAHANGHFVIPKRLRATSLGVVLDRALSLAHDHRYRDGPEFAEALARVAPESIPPQGASLA